ncbi:MAG: TonB-dependent receptor [Myxococcota bacterium]
MIGMGSLYRFGAWLAVAGPAFGADPPPTEVAGGTLPVLRTHTPAAYPERALERAIEGDVMLGITVDEDGAVVEVELLEPGGHGFDAPAIESAFTMRFDPALDAKGRPVAATIHYRYPYRMGAVPPLSIDGSVREQGTKKVLANALIKGLGPDDAIARTRSDDEGRFRFASLAPGTWVLTVSAPGLTASSASVEVPADGYAEGIVLQAERNPEWDELDVDEYVEVTAALDVDPAQQELSHALVVTLPGSLGDPVRALQNMPGVARAPFGSGQLQIRGAGTEDTSYLLDGVRIPIAFHFTAVTTVVAADLLASVEFFPGAWGARYGRALGGVVDLQTNDVLPKHGETSVAADIFQATGFTRQRLGHNTSLSLSARRSYIDTIAQPVLAANDASELRVPRYYDAQLHFVQSTPMRGRVTATLLASDDRFRLLGSDGGDAISYHTSFQKGVLRWVQPTGRGWSTETGFSVGPELQELVLGAERSDVSAAIGIPLDVFGDLPTEGEVREEALPRWSLRHEWLHDPGAGVLGVRAGFDWAWGKQSLEYTVGDPVEALESVSQPALYLEPTLRLGPIDLVPGVRWEAVDASNALRDAVLDPRLRVVADLGTTTVLGGVGWFSQPPAMRELLADEGPSLGFERSRQVSLGVEQGIGPDAKVGVTVYYNTLWDLIVGRDDLFRFDRTALVPGDNFIPFTNAGVGEAYGVELHSTWTTETRILWASLSLARATRQDLPSEAVRPSDADQPVNLTLIGSQAVGRWRFGARFRYASGPAVTPIETAVYATDLQTWVPLYGEPYSDRVPAFYALDLRIDRDWRFRSWALSLYTEVQNATNHANVEIPSWSEDFSQLVPVTGLPVLPVIGVKATW